MTVRHTNPVTQAGFTQIPNAVMLRPHLSCAAKIVYGYLKHLAWRNGSEQVEPAREIIERDLGISKKQVTSAIKELCAEPALMGGLDQDSPRLLVSKRRGLGLPNLYLINDPEVDTETEPSRKAETAFLEKPDQPLTPSNQELELRSNAQSGSQALVAGYVDHANELGVNPPRRLVGQVARLVSELLNEGQEPETVAKALRILLDRRLHPATLPSLIPEARAGPPARRQSQLDADYERLRNELQTG